MARIVITLEDTATGGVKIVSDPSFETMAKMIVSGSSDHTSAHGYALNMIKTARELSKNGEPTQKIWLPKVKRL